MSGVVVEAGPVAAQQDDFDRQWLSAQSGMGVTSAGEPVVSQSNEAPEPSAPAPVQTQGDAAVAPAATEQQAPAQFQLTPEIQARMKQVGAESLDQLLEFTRGYHSLRGQLPNLEQGWKQKYLSPVEQELNRLREERRLAVEDFIKVDPATGRVRSQQDQDAIRAKFAQEEQQVKEQATKSQKEAELDEREKRVEAVETSLLRTGITESIKQYTAALAKNHGVPEADIQRYMKQTRFMERLGDIPDLSMFQHFIIELADQTEEIAKANLAAKQEAAAAKYRDVGNNAGGQGGQQSGARWERTSDDDFDKAWQAARDGRLT